MSKNIEFKSAVETSRKWDGESVAVELSSKIKNKLLNPNFILLFSTIHYENEFNKLLEKLNNFFPNVPIVGGTVPGFMNQDGCYTRGVTSLSIDSSAIDISVGIGHNTKNNPKKSALECTNMIKKNFTESNYSNKLLFILTSGTLVPSLLGTGVKRVYKSKIPISMISKLLKTSYKVSKKGVGREDIIFNEISNQMPDYSIIGGSSIDDNKLEKNYQFFNNEVFTNSVICLGINTNINLKLESQVAVEKTDKYFDVKLAGEKYIINKLDNKPATKTFFKHLNWPDSLMDERLHRRTFFYPILFEKENEIFPEVIGGLIGNNIVCGFDIKSDKLCIGRSSREILINSLNKSLNNISKSGIPNCGIIIYCSALLETLGRDFFKVQEILKKFFKDSPFLLIATGGEDFKIPEKIEKHSNETINMAAFLK